MNIVITVAGASRRFVDAGIETPKWALPFNGNTVLSEVLSGLSKINGQSHKMFLYCLEDRKNLVEQCLANFQHAQKISLTTTKELTGGQAISAANCISRNGLENEPVLIAPGDMIFQNLERYQFKGSQNWLAVAELPGNKWSFAQLDNDGRVIQTAEKNRISSFASVGLYHFKSASQFLELINHATLTNGEYYIAPLYNRLIEIGETVDSIKIDCNDFIDVGTPETYYESVSGLFE
jgi:dTDP-glucose pyrophosphorylase